MKIFRTVLFVIAIAAIEAGVFQHLLNNRWFYLDLLAVFTVLASLKYGWVQSGCLAFGSGFLQDTLSGGPLGVGSISLAAGCLFAGSCRWILFSEHKSTRLVMVFLGSIIVIVTRIMIESMYQSSFMISPAPFFLHTILPTATLNMAATIVFYPIVARYMFKTVVE